MSENTPLQSLPTTNKRIIAAALALFLGCFGAHKFYLGLNKAGIIYLAIGVYVYPSCLDSCCRFISLRHL